MITTRRSFLKYSAAFGISLNEFTTDITLSNYFQQNSIIFLNNPKKFAEPEKTDYLYKEKNKTLLFNFNRYFKRDYEYVTDPLYGFYDTVQPVSKFLKSKKGDCVDYSNLAVSYLLQHTEEQIILLITLYNNIMTRNENENMNQNVIGHVSVYSDGMLFDTGRNKSVDDLDDAINSLSNHTLITTIHIDNEKT